MKFDSAFEDDVLATILRDDAYLKRAARIVAAHHFSSKQRSWLWKAIKRNWDKYRERPTLKLIVARAKADFPDEVKRKPYLALVRRLKLHKVTTPMSSLEELSKFVAYVNLQIALEQSAEALEKGDVEAAEGIVQKAGRGAAKERNYTHVQWVEEFQERQDQRQHEKEHPEEFTVIPTGIKTLDKALGGGARLGELGLVMGTTGRGKSITLNNLNRVAIARKFEVAHFAMEMPARQVATRQDACWMEMPYLNFKKFEFAPSDLRAIEARLKKQEKKLANKLHIISMPVRSASIETLYSALDDLRDEFGFSPKMVVVDSGDHLRSTDKALDSFRLQQADVYWELKRMGEEGGYVMWSSVHAGREWARQIATAEAASESYDKSRIADLVLSLNDPLEMRSGRKRVEITDDDEEDEPEEVEESKDAVRQLELFVAKYRDGESKMKIQLDCDFSRMTMKEHGA